MLYSSGEQRVAVGVSYIVRTTESYQSLTDIVQSIS
jgi:hypothetical protein